MKPPDLSLQLSDPLHNRESLERQMEYWKLLLADVLSLELPTDRTRPMVTVFNNETKTFNLSKDLTEGLKALSRREGVTLFMTLVAAFQVLLHRYSGQDDIVIGAPTAGRTNLEVEGLIGFFVNTLVLRTDHSGDPTFRDLLARVRGVALEAYANQDMPFEELVEVLNLQCDPGRHPLFQVMFVFHDTTEDKLLLNEVSVDALKVSRATTKFDLTLELSETLDGLTGLLEYATDLFFEPTIARLIGHFQTLLEGIITQPDARLSELPLLTEPERRQLLVEWNNTYSDYPKHKCIHQLFEEQVERTPNAIALVFEDQQLSYQMLNAKANQLAHYLKTLGVQADTLVPICMDRSIDLVISILGVLKAGGAYVPIDMTYPMERLSFMLEDIKAKILLTDSFMVNQLPYCTAQIICLDICCDDLSKECIENQLCNIDSNNLAYVIYTSGSTGVPKGVMIPHLALVNHMSWMQNVFPLTSDDKVLQKTSIGFDASVWDFFAPLISGAQLILATPGLHKDIPYLVNIIKQHAITVVQFTPSFLNILKDYTELSECTSLQKIFCGGEALNSNLIHVLNTKLDVIFCNLYGPTETCIVSTYWPSNKNFNNLIVPIGRPIYNTQIYILDNYLQPVPIGITGQLYIGGDGLARGYLNHPELTDEKFINYRFSDKPQTKLYKTGDLARYLPDGNIEYLGRNDFQIKIRGFRIELGEIESKLREHSNISEAVVSVYEPILGDKRLAAYLVPVKDSMPSASELRDFLKSKLPDYMVPTSFVFLDALPLTLNGKLDRKALPEPDHHRYDLGTEFFAPRSPLENQLAKIWVEVLCLDRIGINDNFFELGGHSLLVTQVIVRIGEQLSVRLSLSSLFESPTIAEMAILIEDNLSNVSNRVKSITARPRHASNRVSP
jgi:amino acid adenylation domain-containing protein